MSNIENLIHSDLETAKKMLLEAREEYLAYFKENPDAKTRNVVFGELNKFEWYLLERKHLNHHFKQFNLID
jgi:oxepin-CoA hydrolase/3-oxo-5,6-dehydrosuberyl-CoA semialdehyde dehydrogenase